MRVVVLPEYIGPITISMLMIGKMNNIEYVVIL